MLEGGSEGGRQRPGSEEAREGGGEEAKMAAGYGEFI